MAIVDLMRLERLTWEQKLKHWGSEEPWKIDGRSLRLPSVERIPRGHLGIEDGHIRRMGRPLIGRPCFGIPTAFLRHGGQRMKFNRRSKQWLPTRCMRCAVQDACDWVAQERLRASPAIVEAHRAFEQAGGGRAMEDDRASRSWVRPWRDLIGELIAHGPFESVNDKAVEAHYDELEAAYKKRDRKRKAAERKKFQSDKAKRGEFTPEFLAALERQRIFRRGRIQQAREHPDAPHRVQRMPPNGAKFESFVWMAEQLLRISGRSTAPYTVAKELHRLGVETDKEVNSLRSRVEASQQRLHALSKWCLPPSQDPVVPKLKVSEIYEEIAGVTHYEISDD